MRLGDLAILIASFAIGLSQCPLKPDFNSTPFDDLSFPHVVMEFFERFSPLMVVGTVGIFLVIWRHAPIPRRAVFERPGGAACLAIVTSLAIFLPLQVLNRGHWDEGFVGSSLISWFPSVCGERFVLGGVAVMAAWGPMIATGRWRAEPTVSDRVGRLVAGGWLIASTSYELCA